MLRLLATGFSLVGLSVWSTPATGATPTHGKMSPALQPLPMISTAEQDIGLSPGSALTFFATEFYSPILRDTMPFEILLPPDYYDSDRRYPVLYLLHGWAGDFSQWSWYATQAIAEQWMRTGELPKFIIVTPEGGRSNYWLNHAGGGPRWADYITHDVVQFVDANFRSLPQRESRAIGGLSMGALGAMQLSLNHPELFSIVGLHSPVLRRIGDPDVPAFFGDAAYYAHYDPFVLATQSDAVKRLHIYIDSGEQDPWLGRAQEFRALLDQQGATYEWHEFEGGHDGNYFQQHPSDYLRFYGAQFINNER